MDSISNGGPYKPHLHIFVFLFSALYFMKNDKIQKNIMIHDVFTCLPLGMDRLRSYKSPTTDVSLLIHPTSQTLENIKVTVRTLLFL
jgi:hypothetical protein